MIGEKSKYCAIIIVRLLLKMFSIFPVRKNRIMFNSFNGRDITCNPKYIYNELKREYGEKYEYVWCIGQPQKRKKYEEMLGIKTVAPKTIKYFYYILTSKVYISNGIAPSYVPFRKKQCVIGTWHGGGAYKKGGLYLNSSIFIQKVYKLIAKNVTYVISSCSDFSNKAFQKAFCIPREKILQYGTPRNDIFFLNNSEKKDRIKKNLKISQDEKVVLFAPTFRSRLDGLEREMKSYQTQLDYELLNKSLCQKFGGKWKVLYRAHYYCESDIQNNLVLDVSCYPDMQELLLIADILITDYSSSIWDFIQKRPFCPCFILAEDLKDYMDGRGFYTPITEWPFPLAENNKQLSRNIQNFDHKIYCSNVQQHLDKLGSFETGTASQKIAKLIHKVCDKDLVFDRR